MASEASPAIWLFHHLPPQQVVTPGKLSEEFVLSNRSCHPRNCQVTTSRGGNLGFQKKILFFFHSHSPQQPAQPWPSEWRPVAAPSRGPSHRGDARRVGHPGGHFALASPPDAHAITFSSIHNRSPLSRAGFCNTFFPHLASCPPFFVLAALSIWEVCPPSVLAELAVP